MNKSIYEILNEVETDFTEYEEHELSSEKRRQLKDQILQEVSKMKNEKKNVRSRAWKMKAAAACAAAILAAGSGTALAAGMFSDTIDKLIQSVQGKKYEEEDTALYKKIGENAKPVAQPEDGEDYKTTAEDQGVKISASDAYCDGYNLYFTATLTGNKELLNDSDWISLTPETEGMNSALKVNGKEMVCYPGFFEKLSDDTFVMMGSAGDLFREAGDGKMELKDGDTLMVDFAGSRIHGVDADAYEKNEETMEMDYKTVLDVSGDWQLRFPVTVDTSANKKIAVNKEENGVTLKDAVLTRTGLVITAELPDLTKAPYNDPYNDPNICVKDENGKILPWISGYTEEGENGTQIQHMVLLYDQEKELTLEVTNKNADDSAIASITFGIE